MLLVPALRQTRSKGISFAARDILTLAWLGFVGVTLSLGFFHVALNYLQANVGAVLFSANPVFVALFAPLLLKERLNTRCVASVAIGASGIVVLAMNHGAGESNWLAGIVLMTGSLVAFAFYSVLSRKHMPRFGAMTIIAFGGLMGGAALFPLSWMIEGFPFVPISPAAWGHLIYMAVAATALAYALFFYGLAQAGATRGSMFFFLKPVLASVFAYIILRETMTPGMLSGAALVVGSLGLTIVPDIKAARRPAAAAKGASSAVESRVARNGKKMSD
jgi:drug/metabolite transporter (DMT)-like permease